MRLREVGPAFLFGDEFHSLRDMHGGYLQSLGHFSETGAGLALPLIQRALLDLLGDGHWSIRAPAWVAGLLLLWLSYPIARRHFGEPGEGGSAAGERAALIATALVAVSPLLIFYSHFARIYSLVALLALLLFDRLERALATDTIGRRDWIALTLLAAVLPWAHPTALAFVVPLFIGGIMVTAWDPTSDGNERRTRSLHLLFALAAGGALCGLAYLPARESLMAFLSAKTTVEYYGEFNFMDVAALFAGGRTAAALLLGLAVAAGISVIRSRGIASAPLVLACLGPGLVVAVAQPYGDAYAYARYAIPAVFPVALLLSGELERWGEKIPAQNGVGTLGIGIGIALAIWLSGPQGPSTARTSQHGNTYLGLLALPAFDAPWPDLPHFYRELAELPRAERRELLLLELPALSTRARHLYRQYQLRHGVTTRLAPLPGEFPRVPTGPYTSLTQSDWREQSGADYLIVHLDIAGEIARYWHWIYGRGGESAPEVQAYMDRHRRYGGVPGPVPDAWLAALRAQLGEPLSNRDGLLVWSLHDDGL